mgnify:CR=1 FL=1
MRRHVRSSIVILVSAVSSSSVAAVILLFTFIWVVLICEPVTEKQQKPGMKSQHQSWWCYVKYGMQVTRLSQVEINQALQKRRWQFASTTSGFIAPIFLFLWKPQLPHTKCLPLLSMNGIPHDKGHITDDKLQSLRVNINLVLLMFPGVKVT